MWITGAARLESKSLINALLLMAWSLLETLTEAGTMILLGSGEAGKAGVSIALRRVLAAIHFYLLAHSPLKDYSLSLALLTGTACVYFSLPKAWIWITKLNRETLRELRPYAIMGGLAQLRNLDVPIVASIFGPVTSAPYSLGARIANPILIVSGSIGNVLVANRAKSSRKTIGIAVLVTISFVLLEMYLSWRLSEKLSGFRISDLTYLNPEMMQVVLTVPARIILLSLAAVIASALMAQNRAREAARINTIFAAIGLAGISVFGFTSKSILATLDLSIFLSIVHVLALARLISLDKIGSFGKL